MPDVTLEIPVETSTGEGVRKMAGVASMDEGVLSHMTTRLVATADHAHENFVTMSKAMDAAYLLDRPTAAMMPFTQIQAKQTPGGPDASIAGAAGK